MATARPHNGTYSELLKPYSCSLAAVRFEWAKSVFVDGSLTCDETLVLQLPEEHSDFVQVQQGRLGVFQHGALLFLPGREKESSELEE